MAIGVSLWFDEAFETQLRSLWADLAAAGICDRFHAGPYRPHVTLGVWETLDIAEFVPELEQAVRSHPRFLIHFESVGLFPEGEGTAWLGPRNTDSLTALHRRIQSVGDHHGTGRYAYYAPEVWIPHCSMASHTSRANILRACDMLLSCLPMVGRTAAVGVIDTPAEVELHRVEQPG